MDEENKTDAEQPPPAPPAPIQKSEKIDAVPKTPSPTGQFAEVEKQMGAFEKSTLKWARTAVFMSAIAALFVCLQWAVMRQTLGEMKRSGETTTNQVWQAIGNMNWMARTADNSLHQTQQAIEVGRRQSETSLKATIEQNRLDQRAWVSVTEIRGIPEAGKPWIVNILFRNSGKTIARDVRQRIVNLDGPSGDEVPNLPDSVRSKFQDVGILSPLSLAGVNLPVRNGENIPQAFLSLIQDGKRLEFVYGTIAYRDIFEREHETSFCFVFNPKSKEFIPYEKWNTAN